MPSKATQKHKTVAVSKKAKLFRPTAKFVAQANIKNPEAEYKKAAKDYLKYWEAAAQELEWAKPWKKVLDDSKPPFYKWFVGAKGNIVQNAIDRHLENGNRNKVAILWESDSGQHKKFTYAELDKAVCRLANGLKDLGTKKAIAWPSTSKTSPRPLFLCSPVQK